MDNKVYDFLKIFTTITLPALITMYSLIHNLIPVVVMGIINLILGIFLLVGAKHWVNEIKYDGEIAITGNDPDTDIPNLQLTITSNINEFPAKGTIRFKSVDLR